MTTQKEAKNATSTWFKFSYVIKAKIFHSSEGAYSKMATEVADQYKQKNSILKIYFPGCDKGYREVQWFFNFTHQHIFYAFQNSSIQPIGSYWSGDYIFNWMYNISIIPSNEKYNYYLKANPYFEHN